LHQICATAFVGCQALDLQEQFPPIQPKQYRPIAQQNRGAAKKWFQPCAGEVKEIPTQVDAEGAIQSLSFRSGVLRWPAWPTRQMAGATPLWPANFSNT